MNLKSNKTIVLDLYRNVIKERNPLLIDDYIDDNYIQHSETLKDGKAGLREAIEYLKKTLPVSKSEKSPVVVAVEEGDYVALLLELSFMNKLLSVADLFRLKNGKVIEHWDARQDITGSEGCRLSADISIADSDGLETNKKIVRHLFDTTDQNDLPKLKERLSVKIHRMLCEGNVVVVQSEGTKGEKRHVFYDFITIVDSKINQYWCVEQAIPETMLHDNGMI